MIRKSGRSTEFQRIYKAKDENMEYEKELSQQLAKLQRTRQKYMDMYTDDLITREELNSKIGGMRKEMERLERDIDSTSCIVIILIISLDLF